jgi:hypothetical protein
MVNLFLLCHQLMAELNSLTKLTKEDCYFFPLDLVFKDVTILNMYKDQVKI